MMEISIKCIRNPLRHWCNKTNSSTGTSIADSESTIRKEKNIYRERTDSNDPNTTGSLKSLQSEVKAPKHWWCTRTLGCWGSAFSESFYQINRSRTCSKNEDGVCCRRHKDGFQLSKIWELNTNTDILSEISKSLSFFCFVLFVNATILYWEMMVLVSQD